MSHLIMKPVFRLSRQFNPVCGPANRGICLTCIKIRAARHKGFSKHHTDHHAHLQGKRESERRQNNQRPINNDG